MWNYRITYSSVDKLYAMREVYYTEGVPDSWTANAVGVVGESPEEVANVLKRMKLALKKGVLVI